MAMGQYGGIKPLNAAQPAKPAPARPVAQPYNPAARDQQLRAMGSGPPPAPVAAPAPAPMPPVAAPSFAATAEPTPPGIETMTATSAPLETTNPAAAPTDMQGWMAARPDHQEFHTAIQNATTPDERHAAAQQFADSMRSWADSFRDWRHEGRDGGGGRDRDFGDEFDRLGARDRANMPPADPAVSEDAAAIAEGQRIRRMRQSRTGQI